MDVKLTEERRPALILAIGGVVWKIISEISNIDFLLSIRDQEMAYVFQFVLNYGWLIILAACFVWYFFAKKPVAPSPTGMLVAVGLLCFLFGISVAIKAVGTNSDLVSVGSWGGVIGTNPPRLHATLNTSRLINFKESHKLMLVCFHWDGRTDQLDAKQIIKSNPYDITSDSVTLFVEPPSEFFQSIRTMYNVLLVPNELKPEQFSSVREALVAGARVLWKGSGPP